MTERRKKELIKVLKKCYVKGNTYVDGSDLNKVIAIIIEILEDKNDRPN